MSFNYVPTTAVALSTQAINLLGGAAGVVPYQSAPNTTAFTAAGTSGQFLQSNGTTAPTWVTLATGGNIKSDLSKYDGTFTTSTSIGTSFYGSISVALTATTELLIVWGQASAHAVVWNNTTRTFGTPTLVRTAAFTNANDISAIAISATSVLVCSCPTGSTSLQVVVLSISGSTITVNTAVNKTLTDIYIIQQSSANNAKNLQLVGTTYILQYGGSTYPQTNNSLGITVSGTTPTIGSEFINSNGYYVSMNFVISSTLFVNLAIDIYQTTIYVTPVSVSGTTLTQGTVATVTTTNPILQAGLLSTGRIAFTYRTSGGVAGSIVSISGTTATVSSVNVCTLGQYQMQIFGAQAMVLSVLPGYAINVLTDNSGTAVAGTQLTNPFGSVSWNMVGVDSTKVWVQYQNTTTLLNYYLTYSISGNNPVLSSYLPPTTSNNTAAKYVNFQLPAIAVNGGYIDAANSSTDLITSTYKICPYVTSVNVIVDSFDGISPPVNQAAVSFDAASSTRSALNLYSGWLFGWNSGLPSNVFARRIELA
jgi:hypothetical protein